MSKKITYSKMTFILSLIGFIGSLGFYYGVLRQVYFDQNSKDIIENLKEENSSLKRQIIVLKNEQKGL